MDSANTLTAKELINIHSGLIDNDDVVSVDVVKATTECPMHFIVQCNTLGRIYFYYIGKNSNQLIFQTSIGKISISNICSMDAESYGYAYYAYQGVTHKLPEVILADRIEAVRVHKSNWDSKTLRSLLNPNSKCNNIAGHYHPSQSQVDAERHVLTTNVRLLTDTLRALAATK